MANARSFREGWLTSLTIDKLRNDSAELFLFRLALKADKNGVYHAEPQLLLTALYPLQISRRRLADVARLRDICAAAGLIRLWTAADGRPYVQVLKFRQKTPNEKPLHPLPPGEPDESGQEQFDLPEPSPSPPERKKRIEGKGKRISDTPPAPLAQAGGSAEESLETWLVRLRSQWPALDVDAELQKAITKKKKAGEELERGWFGVSWLPNCTPTVTRAEVFRSAKATAAEAVGEVVDEAPEGWRSVVDETKYGRNGVFEVKTWKELPEHIKAWARDELANRAKQSNEDAA